VSIWQRTKKIATHLPAIAKVVAIAGGASFSVEKFFNWALRTKESLDTPIGLTLTALSAVSATISSTIGRYFNMVRKEENPEIENNDPQNIPSLPATWTYPGTETSKRLLAGYLFFQGTAAVYIVSSGLNGFLSSFSLFKLTTKLSGSRVDSSCENSEFPTYGIVLLHAAAILLAYASIRSFNKYNLQRVREYYNYLFIQAEIRNVGIKTAGITFTGISINVIYVFYSNKATFEILQNNLLCRISDDIFISEKVSLALSITFCLSNFIINGMMTLAPAHKQRLNIIKTERNNLLAQVPSFKYLNPLIRLSIWGNAYINIGLGAVVAFNKFPETINRDNIDLSYHPAMIATSCIIALISVHNQLALDNESYVKELAARAKIQSAALITQIEEVNDNPSLEGSINSASAPTQYNLLESDNIYETPDEAAEQKNPATPINNALSNALTITLFGNSSKKITAPSQTIVQSWGHTSPPSSLKTSPH
jgi:hypothetical protein